MAGEPAVTTGLFQVLAFSTAGDAANGLLFGWDIATFQKWALVYLGVSSLAFVLVWVVGYLRRSG
ncbi:MAG: cytochrome B6 [Cyanobacteriota bacterium]|jgi:hypothetical protein|nr:cytochrome B6 [Cyanobacteriota bacterium]